MRWCFQKEGVVSRVKCHSVHKDRAVSARCRDMKVIYNLEYRPDCSGQEMMEGEGRASLCRKFAQVEWGRESRRQLEVDLGLYLPFCITLGRCSLTVLAHGDDR